MCKLTSDNYCMPITHNMQMLKIAIYGFVIYISNIIFAIVIILMIYAKWCWLPYVLLCHDFHMYLLFTII